MATRSRTLLFLKYRNTFARNHSRPLATSSGYDAYNTSEQAGLIESSDHVIELTVLPPKWIDIVDEVDDDIDQIKNLLPTLESLHKKHILPGFDDRTKEEKEIERLTDEITHLFQQCQSKIKRIANESLSSIAPNQERAMSKNIQTSLASKLQELSSSFRKQQASYLKKLKGRESKGSKFFLIESNDSNEDDLELGFTSSQLARVESSEAVISQREREIIEIAKSIHTIAEIFRELQSLVIDQGTLLDRIDYNVEQMSVNVKSAVRELDKGAQYQKKTRNRKIILLLLLLIFGLIIILIFKPR
ncbi:t-SNARE [Rhizophagus irregularis]|uniref:t-SNARE n=3 Tax=Rhizophagus irregularis TaxID=588596 RepID=A0A2I1ENC0_9GLOM|nr:t-SNARE [Rhizophagus irregularis DAOM 181602=DAOM 197198]EXX70536.1 Tlg2p [Rhizophagus irregularis DAOM 197198w]PKC02775.1 t-SNARE [Rhizophagus irregularis]EXX70537.1 Tlg2p [Rhizophagus irregularis DAOM 197198w]PKC14328.1 t-SNARE [Rhizophagus irregularis]PKC73333.1 t-SNARE [Rhizophagus irregularis]|eukprot:XP_025181949.1 t-SNARE [Rhizophagus irregularis DAOM 181602=DAOM 197198]